MTNRMRVESPFRQSVLVVWVVASLLCVSIQPTFAGGRKCFFKGNVSWYGSKFHGRKTASGEKFDMRKLTAAHRTLPFGTRVLVENPRSGKSVIVRVNDRGPYAKGRVLDLSRAAAKRLGTLLGGVAYVECTVLPSRKRRGR